MKKQIQDLELEHTKHKGKLQTSIINVKSDHSEALRKQREVFDLEAHKTALETEQRYQKRLEELKETHKLYIMIKKLKSDHNAAVYAKEEHHNKEIAKNQEQCKQLAAETVEKQKKQHSEALDANEQEVLKGQVEKGEKEKQQLKERESNNSLTRTN